MACFFLLWIRVCVCLWFCLMSFEAVCELLCGDVCRFMLMCCVCVPADCVCVVCL